MNTAALSLDNPNIEILNYDPKKKTRLIVQSTPKTKSSNREIAIPDGLCELPVRHIFTLSHSSWPNPNNLLFPSKTGTYIDSKGTKNGREALRENQLQIAIRQEEIPETIAVSGMNGCGDRI